MELKKLPSNQHKAVNIPIKSTDICIDFNLLLKETRQKKYHNYRIRIKKDYENFERNIGDFEKLKLIEKKIKKINPSLIKDENEQPKIFMDLIVNESNDLSYIDEAKTSLTKIKSHKLYEIVSDINNIYNRLQKDPTFDASGNLSLEWLKHDAMYTELKSMQQWNDTMTEKNEIIKSILENKIFLFRKSLRLSKNKESFQHFMPPSSKTTKCYVNKKYKKIFYVLFTIFSIILILIFVFLILLIIGVNTWHIN